MLSRRLVARGVSLIEIMIGLTVGLIVLVGMSRIYVNASMGGRTHSAANQLNQDLRASMDIIVNDLRRAGSWGAAAGGNANPFASATTSPRISELVAGTAGCILYSYDATYLGGTSGAVDAGNDFFGFRLAGSQVQTLDQANAATLDDTTRNCTDASLAWQNLTDERSMTITRLVFDTIGSQCIAYVASAYNPSVNTSYQQWRTVAGYGNACSQTASNAPSPFPSTATNTFVETRQINVTITATSTIDPTQSASLTSSVLLRNNRVTSP